MRVPWGVMAFALGSMLAACGGEGGMPKAGDGGGRDGPALGRGQQMLVSMSNARGLVRVGAMVAEQAEILIIDAETQRPLEGVLAEALAEPGNEGYLVRLTRESGAYRPEVVHARRGQQRTVPIGPDTADVSGRAVRMNQPVYDQDFLGETDLPGVTAFAERERRPEIVFVPALDPATATTMTTTKFAVYRSILPRTILALRMDGQRPADGVPVRGQARVVSTSGARRAGSPVQAAQVAAVAEGRMGEGAPPPLVTQLSVEPPDASGTATIAWNIEDPMTRLLAFDVGVDSVHPDKRVGKEVRRLAVNVRRGEHFACVRPVFDGADTDPQVRCVAFDAPLAPAAAEVRVNVRVSEGDAPVLARRPVPVEVEIENSGGVDAPPFQVDVVLSRDGRSEGGLGEVRSILVDGVKAGTKIMRRTEVTAPRDGPLYVVAQADPLKQLREGNAEDNLDRKPLMISPAGQNRAPVLSLAGNAVGSTGGGTLTRGQPLVLRGNAADVEDGDLSQRITWWSSRDGRIGEGAALEARNLGPGTHRIRAQVQDLGRLAAPAASQRGRAGGRVLQAAAAEPPETVIADLQIEVVDQSAPTNSAPAISAGPDLTMTLGGESSPAATASDADGDPLGFSWSALLQAGTDAQPQPSPLADSEKLRPRFRPTVAGIYRLTFAVSDGKVTEKDEVQVNVLPQSANRSPKLAVMLPPTAAVGTLVRAQVTAVDDDMDGLTISYWLYAPPGSAAVIESGETRTPGFLLDRPGTYVLKVRADDGRGGLAGTQATTTAVSMGGGTPPDGGGGGVVDGGVVDGGVPPPPPPGPDARTFEGGGTGCDPFAAGACGPGMGCFLRGPGDVTGCGPAGTGGTAAPCTRDDECSAGHQCALGICRPICDFSRPSCPPELQVCVLGPGNARLGLCDKQMQPMGCDPLRQTGCPTGMACYGPEASPSGGGTTTCTAPGSVDEDGLCQSNNSCRPGLGCMDGPGGRRCRQYCDPAAPMCPLNRTCIAMGGPIGICMPPGPYDGGPPPPPDGGSVSCDPVVQSGCGQRAESCYVDVGNFFQCLLPGTGGPEHPCGPPNDCAGGLGCFDGPGGRLCRSYCDLRNPTCPTVTPECVPIPNSYPWGTCFPPPPDGGVSPPPPDGGASGSGCEPVSQTGCARAEDGCYVVDSQQAFVGCLLSGTTSQGGTCSEHSSCMRGTGCHDRACRRYCDPGAPQCPTEAPWCVLLGPGPYHLCVP